MIKGGKVYEIFSIMDGKYPAISTNLDWKEWKEHLQKWFHEKKIDEYYYEPISACSVFSLELDVNVYADMKRRKIFFRMVKI